MQLLILGATGGTGRELLEQARSRGHQVTAFVRSPQKLGASRDGVTVRRGDPLSVSELRAVLPGHDAVLTALGAPGPGRTTILRDSGRSIVEAMRAGGPRRLLVVSVAALFDDAGVVATLLRHTLLRNIVADAAEMERVVMDSGLDWTIARPPRLTNGPLTQLYRVADGRMPRGRIWVSRADVADFLLNELEYGRHIREIVGMAGGNGQTGD
ncbi:MAG TPA: SDR family oxidoreductase [Thermoanaerobaculia bacterium]|nr:SDR family oxidoreductase [Thermoanaerobaculia bacterium]